MASPEMVYLNGEVVPSAEARVSVEDRGFNFAEGIYEVARIVGGRTHRIEAHLDRLESGARALEIELPITREEVREEMLAIADRNGIEEGIVYLQLTRGAAPRSHAPPAGIKPTLVMLSRPFPGPAESDLQKGVSVITAPDLRWGYCEVKTTGLLPNVMAFRHAQAEGCDEAVLVRNGIVTEATRASVFCVRDGVVYTHPIDNILPGITRKYMIEDLRAEGVDVREIGVSVEDFRSADEVFLTGTATEVLPVARIDGGAVADGTPGKLTLFARKLYLQAVEATRLGEAG